MASLDICLASLRAQSFRFLSGTVLGAHKASLCRATATRRHHEGLVSVRVHLPVRGAQVLRCLPPGLCAAGTGILLLPRPQGTAAGLLRNCSGTPRVVYALVLRRQYLLDARCVADERLRR